MKLLYKVIATVALGCMLCTFPYSIILKSCKAAAPVALSTNLVSGSS